MSLVNDMLRDLDRRRKQSDSPGSTSTLTPVPETIPAKARSSALVYVVLVLVLGGAAVAWFWMQQQNSSTTRSLNVSPAVVNQPAPVDSEPPSQTIAQADQRVTETVIRGAQDNASAVSAIPVSEQSAARAEPESETRSLVAASADTLVSQPIIAEPSEPVTQGRNESPSAAPAIEQATETTGQSETADVASTTPVPDRVNLSAAPTEEVKRGATLTPEEQDVLAVQDALRLIADNKSTAAYALLEKQIMDNRYAHQSRETYAKLLLNEGNLLGASQLADSGLALSANHAGFKKIKARLLIAQGLLDEAVNLLITRAPEVSKDLEYHDILATAQLASRDYEGALISYTGLVQQDQSQGKWWYGFAASQDLLGNSNAARQGYSQAVRMPNLSANLRRRSQERLALLGQ